MKKFWETKAPNWDSVVELAKNDEKTFVGYYHGISKKNNTIFLAQTKIPVGRYNNLLIQVAKKDCVSGRVLKW